MCYQALLGLKQVQVRFVYFTSWMTQPTWANIEFLEVKEAKDALVNTGVETVTAASIIKICETGFWLGSAGTSGRA